MIGSITDWVILIVVVLVLFGGAKKIPELARAMGRAMGEFRKGQAEVEREINKMTSEVTDDHASGNPTAQTDVNAKISELERQLEQLKKERQNSQSQ